MSCIDCTCIFHMSCIPHTFKSMTRKVHDNIGTSLNKFTTYMLAYVRQTPNPCVFIDRHLPCLFLSFVVFWGLQVVDRKEIAYYIDCLWLYFRNSNNSSKPFVTPVIWYEIEQRLFANTDLNWLCCGVCLNCPPSQLRSCFKAIYRL